VLDALRFLRDFGVRFGSLQAKLPPHLSQGITQVLPACLCNELHKIIFKSFVDHTPLHKYYVSHNFVARLILSRSNNEVLKKTRQQDDDHLNELEILVNCHPPMGKFKFVKNRSCQPGVGTLQLVVKDIMTNSNKTR
jgi:hypothetical protein